MTARGLSLEQQPTVAVVVTEAASVVQSIADIRVSPEVCCWKCCLVTVYGVGWGGELCGREREGEGIGQVGTCHP